MEEDEIRQKIASVITDLLNGLKTKKEAMFAAALLVTSSKFIQSHALINLRD